MHSYTKIRSSLTAQRETSSLGYTVVLLVQPKRLVPLFVQDLLGFVGVSSTKRDCEPQQLTIVSPLHWAQVPLTRKLEVTGVAVNSFKCAMVKLINY